MACVYVVDISGSCYDEAAPWLASLGPTTHEIVGLELTGNKVHDCAAIDATLADQPLDDVCADGAYDNE